ncbi:MAG: T9SS type A sorting domain-containing protein [Bacteroidales bacterium]|nr:T9SS type A sorting domain-containing protein [Bacteroidales bacterium]
MKHFFLAAILTLACFQSRLASQTIGLPFEGSLPGAGQILSVNPGFEYSQLADREIDFDSLNMAFTGNWPCGQSFSISASPTGDTLFVGEGGMLDVLDVTDPYNPVQIAGIKARAIIDDSYYDPATGRLFLAAYFSGIEVWDVSDFSSPHRICRIPTNSYPRGGVFAHGNYVYITTVADGFYVADISDPENPVMVGHRSIPGNPLIWDSDYQGNYAYLAAASSGFKVIDFSNPVDPVIAGAFPGMTTGLCVRDTLAYIASSTPGFRILNIKNPGSITIAGSCTLPGSPNRVMVSGNYAYVANSTTDQGGINVVDIVNPSSPALITTYPGFQTYIAGGGEVLGATGGTEGCLILDITDPAQPVEAYAWPLAGFLYQLSVDGNYGYTGSNGFRVFDLSDMTNPLQVGYDPTQGSLAAISDTLAIYIPKSMTANNPVNVMNISNPAQPEKIGQYMAPVMTYDLALKGNYAFVACWWDGFRVIDFSNPQNPVLKAHKFGWFSGAEPGVDFCYVQALDIYDDYLYLVDYLPFPNEDTKGLYVFNISDPENPQFISRYATLASTAQDIHAWEDYVYVADGSGGMEVIDVSDPFLPYTVGYCSLPDGATGIDISWPFVFISDYILGGVQVVDVTVPEFPFVTAYYKPSGVFAMGVTVDENYAIVGDGVAGFQVYDLLTATSIDNTSGLNISELSLFPNPSRGLRKICFSLEKSSWVILKISDITGKEIQVFGDQKFETGQNNFFFNDLSLPCGIYLFQLSTGEESKAVKFIVK